MTKILSRFFKMFYHVIMTDNLRLGLYELLGSDLF